MATSSLASPRRSPGGSGGFADGARQRGRRDCVMVTAIAAALELLETRGFTVLSGYHGSPLYGVHMRGRHVTEHAAVDFEGCTQTEGLVLVRGWVLVSLHGQMLRA